MELTNFQCSTIYCMGLLMEPSVNRFDLVKEMLSVFENVDKDLREAIEFICEDDGTWCNYAIYRYIVIEDCGLYEYKTGDYRINNFSFDEVTLIEAIGYGMFKDITKRFGIKENIGIEEDINICLNEISNKKYSINHENTKNIKDITTEWEEKNNIFKINS